MTESGELERGRVLLREAERAMVLTGAGISAESGVPTFRGEEGLWKNHRPEELATPSAFARDPRLVWEWYAWRRRVVSGCEPNAAHLALARWSAARRGIRIVTQNVDGLHAAAARRVRQGPSAAEEPGPAGGPAAPEAEDAGEKPAGDLPEESRPVQLHGSLFRARCTECGERVGLREPVDASSVESLPGCPACGGLLRPDVVWFGESLDPSVLEEARGLARDADVCLVVGTSAVVQPAASLATSAATSGAALLEVNPDPTPLSRRAEVVLRRGAAGAVPALLEEVLP